MDGKSRVTLVVLVAGFALCCSKETANCPAGYIHKGGNCFKVFDKVNEVSWMEALRECKKVGGTLAEPLNQSTTEFLRELAHIYHNMVGSNQWFIGLTDMFVDNQWSFPSICGQANYTLWRNGTPNEDVMASSDCAVMVWQDDEIHWQDISCTDHKGSSSNPIVPICQVRMHTQLSETGPVGKRKESCPEGFTRFQNHCYYVSAEKVPYASAEEKCEMKGAKLASVHSKDENQFIGDLARGLVYVWLGGTDLGNETFVWSDESPMDYGNYMALEPDYGSGQSIQMNVNDHKWIDFNQDSKEGFVCKI